MIDVNKFVASLIKHYCEAYDIDRTSIKCWFDDALEDQGLEYKNGEIVKTQRRVAAEAKEALYSAPCVDTINGQGITNQVSQPEVTKISDKDWNEVRIQAAIAAMQGLISHQKGYIEAIRFSREIGVDTGNILACTAVEYADALIKKLKGE